MESEVQAQQDEDRVAMKQAFMMTCGHMLSGGAWIDYRELCRGIKEENQGLISRVGKDPKSLIQYFMDRLVKKGWVEVVAPGEKDVGSQTRIRRMPGKRW